MADRDLQGRTFNYPMARDGINLHKSIVELKSTECIYAQNLIFENGMVKILGYAKVSSTEVVANKSIVGLFRFYFSGNQKETLVVAGTKIKEFNGTDWDTLDATIGQSQTDSTPTHFRTWGATDKVYIGNGVDRGISYDGTTPLEAGTATITIVDYSLIDVGVDTITVEVDGTTTVLTEGSEWSAATSNNATATSIASAIDAVTGLSGLATTDTVTITADLTANLETLSTSMDSTEATVSKKLICPSKPLQFLPYQDRLLVLDGNNPGVLTWSKSFVDTEWETNDDCGVRPDAQLYGMTYHSINNSDAGYEASVLLAGANGMYIFKGSDLRTPSTTGNYTIYPLATTVGCNAPYTMKWTPAGTIYLGTDKMVYLLPFDGTTPIPIGDKLFSTIDGVNGIEDLPKAQVSESCAAYHKGYYKLSFAENNTKSVNNFQFWLDVNRLQKDDNNQYGPWYGPMTGNNVSVFANQDGPGDDGELLAGEHSTTVGGFVYEANKKSIFANVSDSINCYYQPYYHPLADESLLSADEGLALRKDSSLIELELTDGATTVEIDLIDIDGDLLLGTTVDVTSFGSPYFGNHSFNDIFFGNVLPVRARVPINPAINARRVSIAVRHNSSTEGFNLLSQKLHTKMRDLIFEGRGL